MSYDIRRATAADKPEWVRMRQMLWPEAPLDYLEYDMDEILADPRQEVFIASRADGKPVAFIEASLREYAEGCETSPVGYIEACMWTKTFAGKNLAGRSCLPPRIGRAKKAAPRWLRTPGWIMKGASART